MCRSPFPVALCRITKDQNTVDVTTRAVISMFLLCVLSFANIVIVTAATTPLALIMAAVLIAPYYVVTTLYRWSARDLSRCDSSGRPPPLPVAPGVG